MSEEVLPQKKYKLKKEVKRGVAFKSNDISRRINLATSNTPLSTVRVANYTQQQAEKSLDEYYTESAQEVLLSISETLYMKNSQYKSLIRYFSNMLPFPYIITTKENIEEAETNEQISKKIKEEYYFMAKFLSSMKLKYHLKQVVFNTNLYGAFFGYIFHDEKSFTMQKFSPLICKPTSTSDGAYNFSINMSIFEKDVSLLDSYPDEVRKKFNTWLKAKEKTRQLSSWVELDPENTICIKSNHLTQNSIPPFAGVFDSAFSLYGYKRLMKNKDELNNYKLLIQKIPMRDNTVTNNDFLVDLDMSDYFHAQIEDALPDNVGLITTPMSIDTVNFEKDSVDSNGISKATQMFWEESGTSQALFSSSMTETSEGIKSSISKDVYDIMELLTQIDSWLKRYVKINTTAVFLQPQMLDVSEFNKEKKTETYLKGAQFGVPFKTHLTSVEGLEPIESMGLSILEGKIFELQERFIPLKSSHTSVAGEGGDDGGRPSNDETGNEDSGETARGRDKKGAE